MTKKKVAHFISHTHWDCEWYLMKICRSFVEKRDSGFCLLDYEGAILL
ncbi:hypothetical protein WD019_20605 [Fictibacillus sp. Mic-4]|nr:hypothetical protein [Fictibacillus gelatini]